MAIFGVLNGILNLETEAWTKGAKKGGEDIDGLNKKTKSFFDTAKGFRGSSFGQSLRLLAGGGALGVVDRLVGDATKMVDKFSEMSGKIADGDANFSDLAGEVARSAPVLGTFVKFWDSIGGAISGATAEIAEQDRIVKEQLSALENRNQIIRDGTEAHKGFTEEIRRLGQERIVDNMAPGASKDITKAIFEQSNAAEAAMQKYKSAMKKINADIAKETPSLKGLLDKNLDANLIGALEKQMADLKSQQSAAQGEAAAATSRLGQHTLKEDDRFLVDQRLLKNANDAAAKASQEIQNLQGRINAAKSQQATLLHDRSTLILDQSKDLAAKIGRTMTTAITDPFKEAHDRIVKMGEETAKRMDENKKRLLEIGKQLTEESLTPMQKLLKEMKQIDVLQKIGTIDGATHDALEKKYMAELDKDGPKVAEYKPIAAIENPFGFGRVHNDLSSASSPMNSLAATAKAQLEEQRKGLKLSPDTIKKLKDGTTPIVNVTF